MKSHLKHLSFKAFIALDRLGLHILPKHYYTPIPDYSWLRANREAWMGRMSVTGLTWNLQDQLSWLTDVCADYYHEVKGLGSFESAQQFGPGYGPIESQVLHCVIRKLRPSRVIEVGSGASTMHMLRAIESNQRDGGHGTHITCIEPFPKPQFAEISTIEHIQDQVQMVPITLFSQLQAGDLLFVDSSHAVKVGSDVNRLYLEIIPSLSPGVFVHIHDIYLPYVYPRDVLDNYFGWQETTLLLALLSGNKGLSVLSCLSALHYDAPVELSALLGDYLPQGNDEGLRTGDDKERHFPSSMWLRTS